MSNALSDAELLLYHGMGGPLTAQDRGRAARLLAALTASEAAAPTPRSGKRPPPAVLPARLVTPRRKPRPPGTRLRQRNAA